MDIAKLLETAAAIFGVLTAIVKFFPTVSVKLPWILFIIKLLGNITNRQTDDEAVRQAETK